MKQIIIFFSIILISSNSFASSKVTISSLIDGYFATDNHTTPHAQTWENPRPYAVNNATKNQFGINLAQFAFTTDSDNLYTNLTMQVGELATYFPMGGYLYEAYIGYKFGKSWSADIGYFITHLGCEAVVSWKNPLSTYSLLTYVAPFYHKGIRLNYAFSDELSFMFMLADANSQEESNENKSFGLYITYEKNNTELSYAGYLGNDEADTPPNGKIFMFHNILLAYNNLGKLDISTQFDLISKEDAFYDKNENTITGIYYGLAASAVYHLHNKIDLATRATYFNNSKYIGDYIDLPNVSGSGYTLGISYMPEKNSYLRFEGRIIVFASGENDEGKVFYIGKEKSNSMLEFVLSYGMNFDLFEKNVE